MLVTSRGVRIYISLTTVNYVDEKMKKVKNVDYTTYFNEKPTGEWKIVGICNPPLPKDIVGLANHDLSCCSDINFTHVDS